MRGYWLKIAAGAAIIFGIGMAFVSAFEVGRENVEQVVEGTGPIAIPLAFIPFNLDGGKLGTLRRVTVYRDSLQTPTRIEVTASIGDSAAHTRLAGCVIAVEAADSSGNVRPNHYRCLAAADTVGADLVTFGDLLVRGHDLRFPLFAPREQVAEVTSEFGPGVTAGDSAAGDSLELEEARVEVLADSMAAVAESLHDAEMARIDSIRRSVGQE